MTKKDFALIAAPIFGALTVVTIQLVAGKLQERRENEAVVEEIVPTVND